MYQPLPAMFMIPTTGEPYLYQYDTLNAPATGESFATARHALDTPDTTPGARYYAAVTSGPAGARVELSADGSTWVDGSVGLAVGAGIYFRAVAPVLGAGVTEGPLVTIQIGCSATEDPDYYA